MVDVADPPAEIAPAPSAPAPVPLPLAPITPAPMVTAPDGPTPSLVTAAPLGKGNWGMLLGGGYTTILPVFMFEAAYGITPKVDIAFRYETVAGLFHYPQIAARWGFLQLGKFSFGARLGVNYSLFAVKSDQTNLTSTIYLSGELMVSRPVTKATDVMVAIRGDFDLWEYRITDGEKHANGTYRYDETVFRVGARTTVTDDLSIFVIGDLKIPIETFTYKAEQFFVIPTIEVGGTFVF